MKTSRETNMPFMFALLLSYLFCPWMSNLSAQESTAKVDEKADAKDVEDPETEKYEKLAKLLSDSVFEGHFTIDGQDGPPKTERYELKRVRKLSGGDFWMLQTRIKYGDHDVTVPLSIPIKWAEKTPVITVDNITIPGLGTFNARVVIADGKYAGTWQHGEVGGHLYGKIVKADQEGEESN